MAAVLLKAPPPLRTLVDGPPEALEHVILKCLEKDLTKRYQTSAALVADLRSLRSGGIHADVARASRLSLPWMRVAGVASLVAIAALAYFARRPDSTRTHDSLAVFPFAVAAGGADAEYLGDGLAESLITTLAREPTLRVKSRHLAFQHRGREAEAPAARALDVDAILTGRIALQDNRVALTAELVDSDGSLLWSERFDQSRRSECLRMASDLQPVERCFSSTDSAARPDGHVDVASAPCAGAQDIGSRRPTIEACAVLLTPLTNWPARLTCGVSPASK